VLDWYIRVNDICSKLSKQGVTAIPNTKSASVLAEDLLKYQYAIVFARACRRRMHKRNTSSLVSRLPNWITGSLVIIKPSPFFCLFVIVMSYCGCRVLFVCNIQTDRQTERLKGSSLNEMELGVLYNIYLNLHPVSYLIYLVIL